MATNDANAENKNAHGMINFQRNGILRRGSYLAFRHLGTHYKVFAKRWHWLPIIASSHIAQVISVCRSLKAS